MTELHPGMRVLHVLSGLGPTNGQYNEHILPLRHERRITVCSLTPPVIEVTPDVRLFAGTGGIRGAWRAIRAALADGDYDVLHAHAPVSGAALIAGIVTSRRHPRRRSLFTLQNSYANYKPRNKALLYPIFAFFPRLVLCSSAVRDTLPPGLRLLGRHKITVVPNAVDTEGVRKTLEAAPTQAHDGFRVVSVARLIPIKDPQALVRAFAAVRRDGDQLVFVGDGPLRPEVEDVARSAGAADAVTFTGLAPRDEVYRQVRGGDVYVSASHGEGLPVAVLEAMACGRPVVLSDIPPHREIAEGTDFIPLVPVGDVDGFAREIARMRDLPSDERDRIGRRCQALVEERYGVEAMHRALADVYARAMGRADDLPAVPA